MSTALGSGTIRLVPGGESGPRDWKGPEVGAFLILLVLCLRGGWHEDGARNAGFGLADLRYCNESLG